MGAKDKGTAPGRSAVACPAPLEVAIYPADLRRQPEETPQAWLERLQGLPSSGLTVALHLTLASYLRRAAEMVQEAEETAQVTAPPCPGSNDLPCDEIERPVLSAVDVAREAFLALGPQDRAAFLRWAVTGAGSNGTGSGDVVIHVRSRRQRKAGQNGEARPGG